MCWHLTCGKWAPSHHSWLKVPLTGITMAGEGYRNQGKRKKRRGSLAPNPCPHGPGFSTPNLLVHTSPAKSQYHL